MSSHHWLERVRLSVTRCGLPRMYATRLVEELSDHAEELTIHLPDGERAEDLLGDPETVAKAAVAEYRAGRFAGRHPLLSFVLAPLILLLFAWSWYIELGIAFVESIGGMESRFAVAMSHVLTFLAGFVVPLGVLGLLWRAYRSSGRPLGWYAFGCLLVASLAGLFFGQFTPPSDTEEATLITEFLFGASWRQALQFAAATVVAGWLAIDRDRCVSPPPVLC